jgi:hypothetical protein
MRFCFDHAAFLGGEENSANQERDRDNDDHDDEERRGDARSDDKDNLGHQSRDDIDKDGAPVSGPVNATAGPEHELKQLFQYRLPRARNPGQVGFPEPTICRGPAVTGSNDRFSVFRRLHRS